MLFQKKKFYDQNTNKKTKNRFFTSSGEQSFEPLNLWALN